MGSSHEIELGVDGASGLEYVGSRGNAANSISSEGRTTSPMSFSWSFEVS